MASELVTGSGRGSSTSDLERASVTAVDVGMNVAQGQSNDPPERFERFSSAGYTALTAFELAFLALTQGLSISDIKAHRIKLYIFLFSVLGHYTAALCYGKARITGSICDLIGHICGSLATASFISMLFPTSTLTVVIFLIWLCHLALYNMVRYWIVNVALELSNAVRNMWESESTEATDNSHIVPE